MVKMGWYTTKEVAGMLQISKMTLYRWEAAGKIPKAHRHPMNKYRVYTIEDIEKIKKQIGQVPKTGGRMAINADVKHMIQADNITDQQWKTIKIKYRNNYDKMKAALRRYGAVRVAFGFDGAMKPVSELVSY